MKIEGVILDWAGTTVDYGCFAPVQAFLDIFQEIGITLTAEEVRGPMGLKKWDHIDRLLQIPRVADVFVNRFGYPAGAADVDRLHASFEPKLFEILEQHTTVIPGVIEEVEALRKQGLKIGSTTGYTHDMLEIVAAAAKAQGYAPDCRVTPDEVNGKGRPFPDMIAHNMKRLELTERAKVVKVGDTVADMEEAKAAGVWAVGVIRGSSLFGYSREEAAAMTAEQYELEAERVRKQFFEAGADVVIDQFSALSRTIADLNEQLVRGERPHV